MICNWYSHFHCNFCNIYSCENLPLTFFSVFSEIFKINCMTNHWILPSKWNPFFNICHTNDEAYLRLNLFLKNSDVYIAAPVCLILSDLTYFSLKCKKEDFNTTQLLPKQQKKKNPGSDSLFFKKQVEFNPVSWT